MHRCGPFQPKLSSLPVPTAYPEYFEYAKMSFPIAEQACREEAVWLDESIFRAGQKGVDDVIHALRKILNNTDELVKASLNSLAS
jgi:hypothetical protein